MYLLVPKEPYKYEWLVINIIYSDLPGKQCDNEGETVFGYPVSFFVQEKGKKKVPIDRIERSTLSLRK